jgi:Zn-dependent protease
MTSHPTTDEPDRLALIGEVRAALQGLMEFESYAWDERGALTLRGRLGGPADHVYGAIRTRLGALGFTPFLRRAGERDELLAAPVVIAHRPPRLALPAILFLTTIFTTLLTGALQEWQECIASEAALLGVIGTILRTPPLLLAGLPFAATLMSILFVHEMGHYVVGRLRRAPVSLPYFIPLPPVLSITGTMGAVIVQREPLVDRRTLLEVGIAGPLAGLALAVPLLIYGIALSPVGPPQPPPPGCPAVYLQEGNSLLYAGLKYLVHGRWLPGGGVDVQLSPVAWGAWIGLLVTALNLMPIGQLDGGHVAYALLGRRADYLAYAMIAVCVLLGTLLPDNFIWLLWAVLALVFGPRHPPPLNDISGLGRAHAALAVFGLIVFVLLFMPAPLRQIGG